MSPHWDMADLVSFDNISLNTQLTVCLSSLNEDQDKFLFRVELEGYRLDVPQLSHSLNHILCYLPLLMLPFLMHLYC